MKLLAFDTSTDRLSVAAQNGARVVLQSGAGGALASAHLIPTVQAVLQEAGLTLAELDAIVAAIEQGDADQAARLSAEHVQKASQGVLRAMAEKAGQAS